MEAQMKVFISWSGDRSEQVAEAIHWWLPHVLQFTNKALLQPRDIEKGKRWTNEISNELGQSQIGIIAMTEENLTRAEFRSNSLVTGVPEIVARFAGG
jgi:hypothetical protein